MGGMHGMFGMMLSYPRHPLHPQNLSSDIPIISHSDGSDHWDGLHGMFGMMLVYPRHPPHLINPRSDTTIFWPRFAGQKYPDGRSFAGHAFDGHASAMCFDQFLDGDESESGAAFMRRIRLTFKERPDPLGRNTRTGIAYPTLDHTFSGCRYTRSDLATRGIFDRIRDQISKDGLERDRVG